MQPRWRKTEIEVVPYSQLAFIYDHVMRHVNYERWANYLIVVFSKADSKVRTVLDISCGTGSLLKQLGQYDFELAGFDESFSMVQIARRKLQQDNMTIPVWCGSMRQFACAHRFDAVVSTYDSLNYCLRQEDCRSVFEQVSALLRPGGLFVFDLCTEKNSRQHFVNYVERDGADEYEYVRQAYYLQKKRIQVNEFTIQWHDHNHDRTYHEIHRQRIYRIEEIKGLIPAAWFELVGIYDGFSRRPGSEDSERVQFVLKRC